MAACEKCWRDAFLAAYGRADTDQATEYRRLIEERSWTEACTPREQCGEMHLVIGAACRCGKVVASTDGEAGPAMPEERSA